MEKKYKTMVDGVYFGKLFDDWRFFYKENSTDDYHTVGSIYPNKDCLLADMYRYLKDSWGYIT